MTMNGRFRGVRGVCFDLLLPLAASFAAVLVGAGETEPPPPSTGLEPPEYFAASAHQKVDRPSLPDFDYAKGYQSGITHYLKDNGIFWMVVSERKHGHKRDTEGDIVVLDDGSLLLAWSDFYTEGWNDGSPCRISMRRSIDGGRTWSPIEVLQEQIGSNVMSVSLLRTSQGSVCKRSATRYRLGRRSSTRGVGPVVTDIFGSYTARVKK